MPKPKLLYTSVFTPVIPAGIHISLSCLTPFGLMQICSRQICAGAEDRAANPGSMDDLGLPSMALDTRFPAGMTSYLDVCV